MGPAGLFQLVAAGSGLPFLSGLRTNPVNTLPLGHLSGMPTDKLAKWIREANTFSASRIREGSLQVTACDDG